MKVKRFLSLLLALVMALSLAAPAFAAGDDPDEGIMPLIQIFPDGPVSGMSSVRTDDFRANPNAGNYIQFWFENQTDTPVDMYLYRTDKAGSAGPIRINGHSNDRGVYYDTTAESGTYYLRIVAQNGGLIVGRLAANQYY